MDAIHERTGTWLIPGHVLSFLAFFLHILPLEDKDIWWDEGWSVWLARHDLSFIVLRTAGDEHPPLRYRLLSLWRPIAGESEFALRLSTVFFAVLTVALVVRMGPPYLTTLSAFWQGSPWPHPVSTSSGLKT